MATYDVQSNPAPAVLRAVCERLRNRAELTSVNISRHDLDLSNHRESILIINGSEAPTTISLGNMRVRHELTLKGVIYVVREGNTEAVADEAMDRAYELEREMQREFRGKDDGHVLLGTNNQRLAIDVTLGNQEWDAGIAVTGASRAFRILFDLMVTADTHRIPG